MPRPPQVFDAAAAVDRLPQPFRMLDKLLAETIEKAWGVCVERQRFREAQARFNPTHSFEPHAATPCGQQTSCFAVVPFQGGKHACLVGSKDGAIAALDAATCQPIASVKAFDTTIKCMDVFPESTPGEALLACATAGLLAVYRLEAAPAAAAEQQQQQQQQQQLQLTLVAQTVLRGQGKSADDAPERMVCAPDRTHVAVCLKKGGFAVYRLQPLPPGKTIAAPTLATSEQQQQHQGRASKGKAGKEAATEEAAAAAAGQQQEQQQQQQLCTAELLPALDLPSGRLPALLPGYAASSPAGLQWQQMQLRPGTAAGAAPTVKGVYAWWPGCYKLLLFGLLTAPGAAATSLPAASSAAAQAASAAAKAQAAGGVATPTGSWEMPYAVTHVAATSPGAGSSSGSGGAHAAAVSGARVKPQQLVLALALADGSVVVWDDRLLVPRATLPRRQESILSVAFLHGIDSTLAVSTADGCLSLCSLRNVSEPPLAAIKLAQPAYHIHCPPRSWGPYVLLACVGRPTYATPAAIAAMGDDTDDNAMAAPCYAWYDTQRGALVGTLSLPAGVKCDPGGSGGHTTPDHGTRDSSASGLLPRMAWPPGLLVIAGHGELKKPAATGVPVAPDASAEASTAAGGEAEGGAAAAAAGLRAKLKTPPRTPPVDRSEGGAGGGGVGGGGKGKGSKQAAAAAGGRGSSTNIAPLSQQASMVFAPPSGPGTILLLHRLEDSLAAISPHHGGGGGGGDIDGLSDGLPEPSHMLQRMLTSPPAGVGATAARIRASTPKQGILRSGSPDLTLRSGHAGLSSAGTGSGVAAAATGSPPRGATRPSVTFLSPRSPTKGAAAGVLPGGSLRRSGAAIAAASVGPAGSPLRGTHLVSHAGLAGSSVASGSEGASTAGGNSQKYVVPASCEAGDALSHVMSRIAAAGGTRRRERKVVKDMTRMVESLALHESPASSRVRSQLLAPKVSGGGGAGGGG